MKQNGRRIAVLAAIIVTCAIGAVAFVGGRAPVSDIEVSYDEATLRGRIDVSARKLYLEKDGEVIRTFDVAVGTSSHPTPRGSFTMRRVIWNPRWVPPDAAWARGKKAREPGDPRNPMGRVKVFFKEPDYYIHGTNEAGSIGTAASHGCVRMLNGDVIEFAKTLMEHGGAPVEPGLIQRLINRARSTREVRLTQPIPLRVVS